jgi:hypothetical protein
MRNKKQSDFMQQWQGSLSDYVTDLAWSPTGRCWAACSAAGEVVLSDPQAQALVPVQFENDTKLN